MENRYCNESWLNSIRKQKNLPPNAVELLNGRWKVPLPSKLLEQVDAIGQNPERPDLYPQSVFSRSFAIAIMAYIAQQDEKRPIVHEETPTEKKPLTLMDERFAPPPHHSELPYGTIFLSPSLKMRLDPISEKERISTKETVYRSLAFGLYFFEPENPITFDDNS